MKTEHIVYRALVWAERHEVTTNEKTGETTVIRERTGETHFFSHRNPRKLFRQMEKINEALE